LGRLFGINISVHFSWILVFLLVAWSLATGYLPDRYPAWTRVSYWTVGIVSSLLLFASVLVHELSHSVVAQTRGRRVRGITLFFLGGVSQIEEESANAGEEFWVAFSGPLTSFILAVIFWGVSLALSGADSRVKAVFEYLTVVNLIVGIFNLLPAFPLDGGRVLRSFVWKITGSRQKADRTVSLTGSLAGFAFMAAGVFFLFSTNWFTGVWLLFIGWFIQSSASSFGRQTVASRALSGRTVVEAMSTEVPTIPPGTTIESLVKDHITKDFNRAYVVALGGKLQGLVTLSDVRSVPLEKRPEVWVSEVMKRPPAVIHVGPEEPLEKALQLIAAKDIHQLVVMDEDRLVGLLSRGDILRVLEIASALGAAEEEDNP
jgi:Zn-dependent protease